MWSLFRTQLYIRCCHRTVLCRYNIYDLRGCVDFTCCSTDFFAIAVKFHFCSIGVNPYRSFAVLVDHIVAVPCSYKMKGRVILFPLASIQIVSIFWETGCFNDAEVAAVRIRIAAGYGTSAGTVPRSRFTDVVKTGPYTFAGNFIFRYGIPDRVMGCFTQPTLEVS